MGISIENLKIGSFYIEKLYLKLDKKLIISADKLIIPKKKSNKSVPNIDKTLNEVKNILKYFQSIELKEVEFKNNKYTILYADRVLYMTNNEFEMAAKDVDYIGDRLHASIEQIYLRKYNITLSGDLIYNIKKDRVVIRGEALYKDIKSQFVIHKRRDRLYYVLNTKEFKSLKPIADESNLSKVISSWFTEKIVAKSYKIIYLKGIADIDKKGITILPKTITAKAITKGVVANFQEGVEPVKAEVMIITFADDKLEFHPKKPYFIDNPLEGSRVSIEGLIETPPILKLDLNISATYNKDVDSIFKSYNIDIPILQKSGIVEGRVYLDIDLNSTKVDFHSDINLTKGVIKIGNFPLSIERGEVSIDSKGIKLSNFIIYDKWYKMGVAGDINLKRHRVKLILDIDRVQLGEYFIIKDSRQPLHIDYSKDIKFRLPKLNSGLNIFTKDSKVVMDIVDINKIKPYITNLPIHIDSGDVKIETKNFIDYTFRGSIENRNCFFYEDNSSCLIKIPISGTLSNQGLMLNAFDKRITYSSNTSIVKVKNLHFDLYKFLNTKKDNMESNKKATITKLKLQGKDSIIGYKSHQLLTDRYDINISSKSDFSFVGKLAKDRVDITQKDGYMKIKANRVTDKILHPLINFKGLQKGRYSIDMLKNGEDISKGEIGIYGGVMRNFKTYNNIMAFINTLPSLATLNKPGFSKRGFDIKKGTIRFTINKDILTLNSIQIEGVSSTISGRGVINLATKSISVEILIMTAREVGKIIGDIPIVGHILMGDNRSIAVGLKITGTLDKPKVKNSAIKDTLLVPIEIIKRTITTPEYIYKKQKEKQRIKREELDLF
jgi:hypothetical protein